ncbi:hypothetical protein PBY51_005328 [Eleginops maclovinus]|uniref:Uncharacterized protein n=1 Tax=Eleginops maclovinus TaxID=56733 RepID=A0AAN7X464_ELEMC|nr:hypothetical protein PBY51_005328 [Eleginops maclovinus]
MDDVLGQAGEKWIQCMYISNDSCRLSLPNKLSVRSDAASHKHKSRVCQQQPAEGATEDPVYYCTGKELSYIPTSNEKTVTYRRECPPDHPVGMHIQDSKMPLGDPWPY